MNDVEKLGILDALDNVVDNIQVPPSIRAVCESAQLAISNMVLTNVDLENEIHTLKNNISYLEDSRVKLRELVTRKTAELDLLRMRATSSAERQELIESIYKKVDALSEAFTRRLE